jgi:hypothetical protein
LFESLETKKLGAAPLDAQKKVQRFVRREGMPRIAGRPPGALDREHNYHNDAREDHQVCETESVHRGFLADIMPN